jgi:hypothetical protein
MQMRVVMSGSQPQTAAVYTGKSASEWFEERKRVLSVNIREGLLLPVAFLLETCMIPGLIGRVSFAKLPRSQFQLLAGSEATLTLAISDVTAYMKQKALPQVIDDDEARVRLWLSGLAPFAVGDFLPTADSCGIHMRLDSSSSSGELYCIPRFCGLRVLLAL